jgi:hypothetical protein
MQMKNALLIAVAAAAMLGAVPASAAESALGRISYIYPDGHRLILDAQKTYALAPGVDSKAIGAAEFVRLSLGSGDMVTAISPGPPELAAYWAPSGTPQS